MTSARPLFVSGFVVGGAAGAAAATTLARAGREVVLVDKATFPRDKCCGDGLTTGALRRLEQLGLDPSKVASWLPVDRCVVRGPSGRLLDLPLEGGGGTAAAVARRADLDAALLDVARDAGVSVHDGHAVEGVTVPLDDRALHLEVGGLGTVRARYAVAADGMWSPLRKALLGGAGEEPGYLGEWHAFRQYLTGVGPRASEALWVWFDEDLLPGYAWSFPVPGGGANVGFGLLRGSKRAPEPLGKHLKELWPRLLERPHVREVLGEGATPESPHKAWPIPARIGRSPLAAAGGRALFVGDAARATDPMTGEGIGQALDTGIQAAEAIVAAGALQPWVAQRRYEHAVQRGLAIDNGLARWLSDHGVAHRKGIRAAIRIAGANGWTRRQFGRWLFEDYERALLATPWRWRRGALSAPGAYRHQMGHVGR
jgi:geranylgeranyl reductase family protein